MSTVASGLRSRLGRVAVPLLAIVTAFAIGAVFIVLTDYEHLKELGSDPAGAIGAAIGGVITGYGAMFAGAIGDPGRIVGAIQSGDPSDFAAAIRPLSESLVFATPFIFVCLGLIVSFRTRLFNLGGNGQFLMGGLGAAIGVALVNGHLPAFLVLVVGLAGGTLFGAAYAFVPGFLKARTGAHEVITTLMLNVAASDLAFLIGGVVASLGVFEGSPAPIPSVPVLFDLPTVRVDYGFVAALVMAAAVSFLLFRTTLGYELRATGFNRAAARSVGMRPGRTMVVAMTLSGGLIGMGSAFFALGPAGGLGGGPTRDMGYVGLALALLAGLRPSVVVLVAILYGALNTGAKSMVIVTGIPLSLLVVIIALAMMFVAAPGIIRSLWRLNVSAPPPEIARATPVGQGEAL